MKVFYGLYRSQKLLTGLTSSLECTFNTTYKECSFKTSTFANRANLLVQIADFSLASILLDFCGIYLQHIPRMCSFTTSTFADEARRDNPLVRLAGEYLLWLMSGKLDGLTSFVECTFNTSLQVTFLSTLVLGEIICYQVKLAGFSLAYISN